MNKLVLSVAIASILGLSACDDESIKDVEENAVDNGTVVTASARVVLDPSAGVLSVPNDLLFSGTIKASDGRAATYYGVCSTGGAASLVQFQFAGAQ